MADIIPFYPPEPMAPMAEIIPLYQILGGAYYSKCFAEIEGRHFELTLIRPELHPESKPFVLKQWRAGPRRGHWSLVWAAWRRPYEPTDICKRAIMKMGWEWLVGAGFRRNRVEG